MNTKSHSASAFTFIELLIILGVICLLACVLGAGTSMNRSSSNSFQCLDNHRQLTAGWKMYSDDNGGRLVYNHNITGGGGGNQCWVAGVLDFVNGRADNTNTLMLVRHDIYPNGAFLGPYVKSASIFKCPADKSFVTIAGQKVPRVRSISMNNFFGEGASTFESPSSYTVYTKASQIKSPAALYLFVDEHEQSINDGAFLANPAMAYQMVDFPASRHDSAGVFSFVDSHTEIHKWTDIRTMPPTSQSISLNVNIPGDEDITWLQQHASELK
jgi:hypothetical protein